MDSGWPSRAEPCESFKREQARKQVLRERERKVEALRQELFMSPMKSQFVFTRDELIELIGLPDGPR